MLLVLAVDHRRHLIPVHDQSITAVSNNYGRSINTQIIICAHRRRMVIAANAGPVTATTSSWPVTPWRTCSMVVSSSATADTAASLRSAHRAAITPAHHP